MYTSSGDHARRFARTYDAKGRVSEQSFVIANVAQLQTQDARKQLTMKARLRSVTIVPYDWAICQTYGELKARLQEKGKSVADNDLWIAARAVRHSIPLVSNNRGDFERIPRLVLISEAPGSLRLHHRRKCSRA